jgi:hypothetical protein
MLVTLMLALGIGGTVAFWSEYKWRREEFDLVKGVPEGFESVAAYSNQAYTLRTDAGSSLVRATVASVELFDGLRVRPLFGRTSEPGEDRAGAEPVVIMSYSMWEREFSSNCTIVGQRINLDGTHTPGPNPALFHHYPVRLNDDLLRLQWWPGVGPVIDDVLSRFGPSVPVERELDFTRPVSGLEAEDQILELARLGEKLAAVGLARRTFGFSLAEATGFVEDLLGPDSEPSPWAGI